MSKRTAITNKKTLATYSKARAWGIWVIGASFFFYQFILRLAPGQMIDELMSNFKVDASEIGALGSAYYFAYSFMQIPTGLLSDRFGARRIMTAMSALAIGGVVLFLYAQSIGIASFARFIIGAGSAAGLISTVKVINMWFPTAQVPVVLGLTFTLGTIGATFAGGPLAALIKGFGWQFVFQILIIVGLILLGFIWLFIRDEPATCVNSGQHAHQQLSDFKFFKGLKMVATNRQIWLMALAAMGCYLTLALFSDLWGSKFLMIIYNISEEKAGFSATSVVYLGMAIGALICPMLANVIKSYRRTMMLLIAAAIGLWMMILMWHDLPYWLLNVFLFVLGVTSSAQTLSLAEVALIIPRQYSAVATAFANMIVMLSVSVFQRLSGPIIDFFWNMRNGALENGIPIYNGSDFRNSYFVIIGTLALSLVMAYAAKETYKKR